MPRRRLPPDTRPNWRDPNMSVVRNYTFPSGESKTIIDPDYEQRYREHCMTIDHNPDFRSDPTYNLRKPRK